jgi:hypothetical protein
MGVLPSVFHDLLHYGGRGAWDGMLRWLSVSALFNYPENGKSQSLALFSAVIGLKLVAC